MMTARISARASKNGFEWSSRTGGPLPEPMASVRTLVRTVILPVCRAMNADRKTSYLYIPPADSELSLDDIVEELIRQHPGVKSTRVPEGILIDWS